MSSHASRDRRLVTRIKDTMLRPITEMKARKRKASPGVIDLTCPTQKRPRSASGGDIIIIDEDTQSTHGRRPGERAGSFCFSRTSRQSDHRRRRRDEACVKLVETLNEENAVSTGEITIGIHLTFLCRKKDKYQILHFPLTAPLTDAEKSQRKVVTSLKL
jgi:hypothetical protein